MMFQHKSDNLKHNPSHWLEKTFICNQISCIRGFQRGQHLNNYTTKYINTTNELHFWHPQSSHNQLNTQPTSRIYIVIVNSQHAWDYLHVAKHDGPTL